MSKSIKQNTKKSKNKTTKNKTTKNKTTKNKIMKNENSCVSGLKSFELKFQSKKQKYSIKQHINVFKKRLTNFVSPTHITPENDFYTYINYYWLKNAYLKEEQRYITQIDDFRLIQDKVYSDLKEIILDYIKSNNNKLSSKLKIFYDSVINMNTLNQSNEIIKEIVHNIDKMREDKNGVWKLLAYINENEIIPSGGSPFVWSISGDDKEPDVCRCFINGPELSILDMTVYYDDKTDINYKAKKKHEFNSFVKKLSRNIVDLRLLLPILILSF
jgi:predicted metalloendopeptidase